MAYTTKAEMTGRFGDTEIIELTDRLNTGVVDVAVLNKSLADADALINSYLGGRYTLPLLTTPDLLKALASDIARFKLWDDKAPEEVRQRYDDALAQLKLIAQGVIVLPPDSVGVKPSAAVGIEYFSSDRVFSAATLEDY